MDEKSQEGKLSIKVKDGKFIIKGDLWLLRALLLYALAMDELQKHITTCLSNGELLNQINAACNLEEIQTLCFLLNTDYDTLRGEGKEAKIRELIQFMDRNGRRDELVQEFFKRRSGRPGP